ncbi:MAG: hypothetical protein M1451_09455, partial [Acidobacteria bacterium]|nr:hypothetical protein [Acidobacteriota bacterium]
EFLVEFCEKQKLKMILGGGREAWKVKDFLKQKNIPVVLGRTHALPLNDDEPYDKPYSAPGELAAAGVKIAFGTFDIEFVRRTSWFSPLPDSGGGLPRRC